MSKISQPNTTMTGQEWYDRFIKELGIPVNNKLDMAKACYDHGLTQQAREIEDEYISDQVLGAAKRAAGLES